MVHIDIPWELQVANISNAISLLAGMVFLFLALKNFGGKKSRNALYIMLIGMMLYSILHEGLDVSTGTIIGHHIPDSLMTPTIVFFFQTIGSVIFFIGSWLYIQNPFEVKEEDIDFE